jgi:predicted TIM-barrel fold metal-dependent hydrolase
MLDRGHVPDVWILDQVPSRIEQGILFQRILQASISFPGAESKPAKDASHSGSQGLGQSGQAGIGRSLSGLIALRLHFPQPPSGRFLPRIPNAEIVAAAQRHPDVLIPFASIDPRRGDAALAEARALIAGGTVRGFKFHPNLQQIRANDERAYPLYQAISDAVLVALFHTGHTGIGAGLPGGGGIRLRLGHPMDIDDVAVDFPDLRIVMAHPSFPWQDEAISIALHKPQVSIDLSGWSPRLLPPDLVRHATRRLRDQVLFGSDYPLITPERWLAEFDELEIDADSRERILRGNAIRLLGLDS